MEILQFLLSFLADGYKDGKYKQLFNLLKDNSFDLKRVVQNADLSTLAPMFLDFMSQSKNSPQPSGESYGIKPIDNIADKKIVECLNSYLSK